MAEDKEGLLLTDEEVGELLGEFPMAIDYFVADIISKAQLSKVLNAGYKSPEAKICQGCPDRFEGCITEKQCKAKIEEAKRQERERILALTDKMHLLCSEDKVCTLCNEFRQGIRLQQY